MLVVSLLSTHSFSDYLLFAFNQMSEKEGKPFAHCIHRQEMTQLLKIQALEMSTLFIIKRNYYVAMILTKMLLCRIDEILQDSDLEEEEDKSSKASRQGSRKGGQRQNWIKEGEEDITDLMDTSAAKKVMGENVP